MMDHSDNPLVYTLLRMGLLLNRVYSASPGTMTWMFSEKQQMNLTRHTNV